MRNHTVNKYRGILWVRNCCAYIEPMTSHALGELAGMHVQQRAAGGRHRRHLERMTSYQKSESVNRCVT